jgi:hypothetical protein
MESRQPLTQRGVQSEDMRLPGAIPQQFQKFAIQAIEFGAEPRFRPFSGHLLCSMMSRSDYYIWSQSLK